VALSYRAAQTLIKRGNADALSTALRDGLDANLANGNGWTLLMLAAVEGSVPIATLLLERGADPGRQNAKGQTASSIASERGFTALQTLLSASTS
jgi:uncharacterized protein